MERMKKALRPEGMLRVSDLLRLMQDIASEDAERRGGGQGVLLSRGCTWVLVKNRLEISRWPAPGEELTLLTWPMQGRFALYPRLFELRSAAGELLVRTDSLWAVMDLKTRTMLPGEERGIALQGVEEGRFRPARRITVPEGGAIRALTPAPDQIDANGHMNNAAYLDAAEAMLPEAFRGRTLRAVAIDYEHEILPGRSARVRVQTEGDSCFFEGSMDEKICFRLREDFAV